MITDANKTARSAKSQDPDVLWEDFHSRLELSEKDLLALSRFDRYRRVYVKGRCVFKVVARDFEESSQWRAGDLVDEYRILKECEGVIGVPRVHSYYQLGGFDILVLEKEFATPLDSNQMGICQYPIFLSAFCLVLSQLCRLGISHNDLLPGNVLIGEGGRLTIVDFDQATRHRPLVAYIRTFLGIPIGGAPVHGSAFGLSIRTLGTMVARFFPKKIRASAKRILGISGETNLPHLSRDAPEGLKNLREAWRIAQGSNASAPGQQLAYYSFVYDGYRFPGERKWSERWQYLRNAADYSGKRVLELGCNMGLLSCFLLKEAGAKAALGVDYDGDILRAARLVAQVLGVTPDFRQVNLDTTPGWESAFDEFRPDLVFALNVLNWVREKDRLLGYLASVGELVFEGHESVETEKARLRQAGFSHIELVTMTERGRPVLYCNRL